MVLAGLFCGCGKTTATVATSGLTTSTTVPPIVWVWLPGLTEPVFAGAIEPMPRPRKRSRSAQRGHFRFAYGPTYLDRADAISLYAPELPLTPGWKLPSDDRSMAGCLRDGSPDSWGQRVLENRLFGVGGSVATDLEVDDLTYLLESVSNRIGALDFQASNTSYVPRQTNASLDELHEAAQALETAR